MDIVPSSSLLRPGRRIGDYVLLIELGRGGFGVVFEAEDQRDGTHVALKTLRADLSSPLGQRVLTRFLMEVRAVRQIRHPNVVKYIEAGQLQGDDGSVLAYFAMELLQGETLEQIVRTKGPMSPPDAALIIRQAAVGLYTAHCQGIIHRDVKPGNIILNPSGRAVVTDFGVCKILELQNVTKAGQVVGTARYLAPEQFLGQQVDARTDVFALGALLFYLLSGEHLRIQRDLLALSRLVAAGEDARRVTEADGISPAWRALLHRAVARAPEQRFSDALMLAHALEEVCFQEQPAVPLLMEREGHDVDPERTWGDASGRLMAVPAAAAPEVTARGAARPLVGAQAGGSVPTRTPEKPPPAPVQTETVLPQGEGGIPWQMGALMAVVASLTAAFLWWFWGV
jgi:serine/threonine-protein kinase